MLVIGLISGTSADAIDAALCEISGAPPAPSVQLRATRTHPFPPDMQPRILKAGTRKGGTEDLAKLHFELGELFAEAALALIDDAGIEASDVDLIGSHGQNFWHAVNTRGEVTATLQLTEAAIIAERSGITTISNFPSARRRRRRPGRAADGAGRLAAVAACGTVARGAEHRRHRQRDFPAAAE